MAVLLDSQQRLERVCNTFQLDHERIQKTLIDQFLRQLREKLMWDLVLGTKIIKEDTMARRKAKSAKSTAKAAAKKTKEEAKEAVDGLEDALGDALESLEDTELGDLVGELSEDDVEAELSNVLGDVGGVVDLTGVEGRLDTLTGEVNRLIKLEETRYTDTEKAFESISKTLTNLTAQVHSLIKRVDAGTSVAAAKEEAEEKPKAKSPKAKTKAEPKEEEEASPSHDIPEAKAQQILTVVQKLTKDLEAEKFAEAVAAKLKVDPNDVLGLLKDEGLIKRNGMIKR